MERAIRFSESISRPETVRIFTLLFTISQKTVLEVTFWKAVVKPWKIIFYFLLPAINKDFVEVEGK